MKKRLAGLIAIALVLTTALAGCEDATVNVSPDPVSSGNAAAAPGGVGGGDKAKFELRIAAQESEEHNDVKSLHLAADAIAEKTNGDVNITIYPSNQLGDYTQVYDEVMAGTIDMACITIPTSYDKRLEMLTVPYLVTNYEDAINTFLGESEFRKQLDAIQLENGVRTLTLYLDGFMGIGATKSISDPMDFSSNHNGMLMRCPSMDSYLWTALGMNYATATIPYSDLYSALQTGVCDGWVGGSAYVNYLNFRDVLKYFSDSRYIMEIIVVIINEDTWNRLPDEYKEIVSTTFQEESLAVAKARETLDEQAMKDMADMGIEIHVPTQEELDAMRAHFQAEVWPKYKEVLGDELYGKLLGA